MGRALDTEVVVDSPRDFVAEHIRRYVDSDGVDGYLWRGVPTLLLTTRGRKTGQLRRTALIFGRSGDDLVVVASRGGAERNPLWFENLIANPAVKIQIKGSQFQGAARIATEAERPGLWELMCQMWPAYEEYRQKTVRVIPVVILAITGGQAVPD